MRDLRKSQLAASAFVGDLWRDGGTFDETLQYLKQMWHVLAAFGKAGFT